MRAKRCYDNAILAERDPYSVVELERVPMKAQMSAIGG
jgi:hypothetical protein